MLRSIALATLVLSSIWAFANPTPILVDCGAGQSLNRTLAALNKLTPATVQFTGTCAEFVLIDGFNDLTIKGTKGATIQQPTTAPPVGMAYVLSVKASQSLTLSGFTIQSLPSVTSSIGVGKGSSDVLIQNVSTVGSWGIVIYEESQVWLVGVNVNVTSGYAAVTAGDKSDVHIVGGLLHRPANSEFNAGLFVVSGHVTMQGMTIRDMQQGIDIGASGSVDLQNFDHTSKSVDVTIENPAGTNFNGVIVSDGSSLNLGSARLLILNAGQSYGFNSGAVYVTNSSDLNAGANLVVTGSHGQGVIVSNDSHADLAGSSITGSAHGGLVVVNLSTASVGTGNPSNNPLTTISGNGTDLFCDSRSQIAGGSTIGGATVVQCSNLLPGLYESLP